MTDAKKTEGLEAEMADSRIYEAAFHIVPHLEEAAAAAEAQAIRVFATERGATIMGEGAPMLMGLAYPIQKDIDRKRHTFTRAFFGWFVFEASPEAAHAVKEMLATRDTIVRSLVIKTSKEAAADRRHPALSATPSEEAPIAEADVSSEASAKEEKQPMDVEQVDAEIAKLVVE